NLFTSRLLWMDDNRLVAGKNYFLKLGTKLIPATVMNIKYKIDVNEGTHIPVDRIYKNEIAKCEIAVADKIAFSEFEDNEAMGSFILIDRVTNMTSACGIVLHSLRRSDNLVWQNLDITREFRAEQKGQEPKTLWFTGLSGSGKSTLANALEKRLAVMGKHTMLLDGDNIRMGLNRNLGFKEQDRIENIRRVAEVARLMNDAGLIVLTSFISPYENDRQRAREIVGPDSFVEVYVNTPLEECEKRDVKGLYKKARAGEIPNFTGISSPYEVPQNADIIVETVGKSVDETVDEIIKQLGME
ncbi:MAG: adenylyl-sulfate kinase, partial [Lachnospiraceae bacterium]|nr:adenylyl-sulfate kinase [Lachnospiraceae bacterium]